MSLLDGQVKLQGILQVAWVSALVIETLDCLDISKPDHFIEEEVKLGR